MFLKLNPGRVKENRITLYEQIQEVEDEKFDHYMQLTAEAG